MHLNNFIYKKIYLEGSKTNMACLNTQCVKVKQGNTLDLSLLDRKQTTVEKSEGSEVPLLSSPHF